jgi:Tfp pilus assembly protein PilF
LAYYSEMDRVGQEYGGEEAHTRIDVGFVYLAQGDLERAVDIFKLMLQPVPTIGIVHAIQATYGLACVAYAQGALDSAVVLAQDALSGLVRLEIRHRVESQIQELLEKIGRP